MLRFGLRAKIQLALVAAVVCTTALSGWAVNDRIVEGAQREANRQARSHAAQARALYNERAATLIAEGEAIALHPAVGAALVGGDLRSLRDWAVQVTAAQATAVTVVDVDGRVVARGHAPEQTGDALAPQLEGLRLALAGQTTRGAEDGDELGLALRAYVPVRRDGQVVGALVLANPLDERFLGWLATRRRTVTAAPGRAGVPIVVTSGRDDGDGCDPAVGAATTCHLALDSPAGRPAVALTTEVSLKEIDQARAAAQRALWLVGGLALVLSMVGAWFLARALTNPLARFTALSRRMASGAYDEPVGFDDLGDEIGELARSLERMREQVATATAALRRERDVLDAVLESVEEAIFLADATGAALVANRHWTALFEPLEHSAVPLTRVGGDGTFGDAMRGWLADPARTMTADFEQRGHPYRRFRVYTAPVRHLQRDGDADVAVLGRLFVARDVTQAGEAERLRAALLSSVSHELRSPLTAIKGYTGTLLHGGPWDEETAHEFLAIVDASADKLDRLVEGLLDAAQAEAGALRVEREPVRIEQIARRVIAQQSPLAPGHSLRLEAPDGLPLAEADPLRVEQVLTNLVENAIKYAPAGGPITIWIRDGAQLTVGVRDQGPGIPPEHADRLFERFYRGSAGANGTARGLGLGLAICKGLVEAHGGRIWVESSPGAGSTFAFTVPKLRALDCDEAEIPPDYRTERSAA